MNVSGVIFFPSRAKETEKQKKSQVRVNLAFILARATILQPLKYKFTKRTNQSCRARPVTFGTVAVADSFELVTPHQLAPGVFQICIILQLLI